MNLRDMFKYNWWPVPTIEQIDELIRQLNNMKNYFVTSDKAIQYNTFMYSQMKKNMTTGGLIPSTVKTISSNLRDIVEQLDEETEE